MIYLQRNCPCSYTIIICIANHIMVNNKYCVKMFKHHLLIFFISIHFITTITSHEGIRFFKVPPPVFYRAYTLVWPVY